MTDAKLKAELKKLMDEAENQQGIDGPLDAYELLDALLHDVADEKGAFKNEGFSND